MNGGEIVKDKSMTESTLTPFESGADADEPPLLHLNCRGGNHYYATTADPAALRDRIINGDLLWVETEGEVWVHTKSIISMVIRPRIRIAAEY
jgi:hypothetical protein